MKRLLLIASVLLLVFTASFGVAHLTGWTDEERVQTALQALRETPTGQWTVAGSVFGLLAADLLLPVPSSVVMTFSGYGLGIAAGTAVSFAGSMLAAAIGFYLCRWYGQRAGTRLMDTSHAQAAQAWFEDWGLAAVIVSRPVPMLTEILSCLAGLSQLSPRRFFVACAFGTLPVCLLYAWAGASSSPSDPAPAILGTILLPAGGWLLAKQIRHRWSPDKADADRTEPPLSPN